MNLPEGFSEFWHLYPRRVCKLVAIKAWERINPDINLRAEIISALRWQNEHVFRYREMEKIPHPATWLNGRRWEDEKQTSLAPVNGHAPVARNFRQETTNQAFAAYRAQLARLKGGNQ